MKKCGKCKKDKDKSFYSKNSNKKDKLHTWCKECCAEYISNYRTIHKDKIILDQKKYRLNNKEKAAAYIKEYRLANKEKIAAKVKQYRLANLKRIYEINKKYHISNPEKRKQYTLNYRGLSLERGRNERLTLSDKYVRELLCGKQKGLVSKMWPISLVQAKREQILIKRKLKELNK